MCVRERDRESVCVIRIGGGGGGEEGGKFFFPPSKGGMGGGGNVFFRITPKKKKKLERLLIHAVNAVEAGFSLPRHVPDQHAAHGNFDVPRR